MIWQEWNRENVATKGHPTPKSRCKKTWESGDSYFGCLLKLLDPTRGVCSAVKSVRYIQVARPASRALERVEFCQNKRYF